MVRPRGPQNATGDAEIGQASDRYRSEIGQISVGNRTGIGQISADFASAAAHVRISLAYPKHERIPCFCRPAAERVEQYDETSFATPPCGPLGRNAPSRSLRLPDPSTSIPARARCGRALRPGRTDSHHRTSPLDTASRLTSPFRRCRREEGAAARHEQAGGRIGEQQASRFARIARCVGEPQGASRRL